MPDNWIRTDSIREASCARQVSIAGQGLFVVSDGAGFTRIR
ncbi:hypothetical protein I552_3451 [Mycobacterium xenopi 3993]|nr:hypothetical protein I552_3451 [Mycobacterium xenopi 3993]